MASSSSQSMDDKSFSERVKKTFGSLFTTLQPSPASLSDPLWSLSGAQAEKKEWRRDKDTSLRDSNPCSSSFDDFLSQARKDSRKNLKNYRKELQDDLDNDEGEDGADGGNEDFHDWDVEANIGLDSTLDNEDEEDTFDKVALGRENAGDRLYMSDVKPGLGSLNVSLDDLPGVVESWERDPRANRVAARIRLKEDDAEASSKAEVHKPNQSPSLSETKSAVSAACCANLKPILKRKDHESNSKASKRVRFDPAFITKDGAGEDVKSSLDTKNKANDEFVLNGKISQVPDYVQNPSKYTRYSLDSTGEISDTSNSGSYMDFVEMMKKREKSRLEYDSDIPADLTKSVTFVPKKKLDASKGVDSEMAQEKGSAAKRPSLPSTFLCEASEEQETVDGDMEVDEAEKFSKLDNVILFKKQGRQYRAKPNDDEAA